LVPTPQIAAPLFHAPIEEKSTKGPQIKGAAQDIPKEPNYKREEILLVRNSRRRPLPARNTQNKVRRSHNLGRKKRRYPKRVEPWKEGDFS